MPARSEQQQKLFGLALSVKRGETPRSEASDEVLKIVDTMSEKDIEDFAGTKHTGLPKKVEQKLRESIREILKQSVVSEAITKGQLMSFNKLVDSGENVVVYGNNGKRYIYQHSGDYKSVAVTDDTRSNPERTYQVLPINKIKKITVESVVNEASGDVWYIQKWDEDGDATTVKRYTTFNKKQMQSDFDKVVKSLGDDEEAHFMKDSKRYVGEYILSVVNQNGKLKREITKGSRTVYTPYKMNSDNISESVVNEEFKSKDSTFEKVWSIFDKKDYFGAKEIAKTQIGNFERALQKNDKGAQEILDKFNGDMDKAKDYIFQVITDREKAKAFENYKALKGAVDSIQKGKPEQGAVGYVKRIIHNNSQKYSIALYNALRNKKFNNWKDIHADVDSLIGESVVSEGIKKGSVIIPYAMDKYGEFIVDKVFKNKKGETSYTGKFKKSGEKREFILHSKDRVVKESVNEAKVELDFDLFKNYNQRRPDKTMKVKVDDSVRLSKYLASPEFNRIKKQYDYVEVHYGDKFLGSMMAGTDNWKFKKGSDLSGSGFKESVNEDVWTSAQKKQVEKLDNEFRNLLAKKGIEPYSNTASKMWKSAGFQKNFQQIFQKDESVNETKFYAFFNNKKHEVEGKDLWDAKQKAITMLKVPKSKVGLLAIVNAKEHERGSFQFESVNEAKGNPKFKVGQSVNYIPKLSGLSPNKKLQISKVSYKGGDELTQPGWYYQFKGTNLSSAEKDIKLAESVVNERTVNSNDIKWEKNPKGEYIPTVKGKKLDIKNDTVVVKGKPLKIQSVWASGDITLKDKNGKFYTLKNESVVNEARNVYKPGQKVMLIGQEGNEKTKWHGKSVVITKDGKSVKLDKTGDTFQLGDKWRATPVRESVVSEAKEVEVSSRAGRIANDVFNDSYRKVGKQTSTLTFKFNKSEDYKNFVDDLKGAGVNPKDIF